MKLDVLNRIYRAGVVAIIRVDSLRGLHKAAQAIHRGGIDVIEVTMTTPGALDSIRDVAAQMADEVCIGAGSVLDAETARLAVLAGARFLVTPVFDSGVIRIGNRYGVPVIMGCYTPTECKVALENGADLIKLFPASEGGAGYLKALRAPLPQLPVVPTGGITPDNAPAWLEADVFALGVGSALVNSQLVQAEDYDEIARRAAVFHEIVRQHRPITSRRTPHDETDIS